MGNELIPISEVQTMAVAVAKSGLFGKINTPERAFTLMMLCQSEQMHPMKAMQTYHLIDAGGQITPSMKSDAMLARFQDRGGEVDWLERTDTIVSAVFSKNGKKSPKIIWDTKRAGQAGLLNKNTWKSYPCQMLTARVISEGIRLMDPGVCSGIYTPEEVQDFVPQPSTPQEVSSLLKETPATVESSEPLLVKDTSNEQVKPSTESKVVLGITPTIQDTQLPNTNAEKNDSYASDKNPTDQSPVLIAAEANRNMDMFAAMKDITSFDEPACNAFLVEKKWIHLGQTWRDLIPSRMESIISKSENFVARINKWKKELAANNA